MLKRGLIFIFGIVFLLCLVGSVSAKDLYVDVDSIGGTCSDSYTYAQNDISHPFCRIHTATSIVNPGDVVYIRSGNYFELSSTSCRGNAGTLFINRAGTPGNPITFKGYPGDVMPIIVGDSTTNAVTLLASDIVLDSLEITNGYINVVFCGDGIDEIVIRNSHIHHSIGQTGNNNGGGIIGMGTVSVYGNYNNILIENNEIHDNKDPTCFSGTGAGIEFYGLNNSIIRNNHIYNEWGGIWLKSTPSNVKIYNNTVHDVVEGIYHFHTPINLEIFDNVVYNSEYAGIGARQSSTTYPFGQNISYYNNIVYGSGIGHLFYEVNTDASKVYNNIFYYGRRGACAPGEEFAELTNRGQYLLTNFEENNNFYYHPTNNQHFCWNSVSYDLNGWRSYWDGAGGNPSNGDTSISGVPLFISTNPSSPDFLKPASNSPAIDAGTIIPGYHCTQADVETFSGCRMWYGSAPDIGAFEYLDTGPTYNPDVNSDGSINVIDLAIVIFNQGHNPVTEPNYAHLDFDEDGQIDFGDVGRVMNRMGGSC